MTSQEKIVFFKKFYPLAQKAGDKYNISPLVILAQGAFEGNYGTSYGARIRKNHFGITAFGSKNEYWDGTWSFNDKKTIKFRIYKTDKDSFYDFARLIREKYTSAANVSSDYAKYAKAIAYSPYISEVNGDNRPNYEKSIIDIANFITSNFEKIKEAKKKYAIGIAGSMLIGFGIALLIKKIKNKQTCLD